MPEEQIESHGSSPPPENRWWAVKFQWENSKLEGEADPKSGGKIEVRGVGQVELLLVAFSLMAVWVEVRDRVV